MAGQVIVFVNQKGGVAKTTTTLNVGASLVEMGYNVLLIDMDPQGSLTELLGFSNHDDLIYTVADLMLNVCNDSPYDINEYIRHIELENLDLIPSNITLSGAEIAIQNTVSRELILSRAIRPLKQVYDYILIDSLPSLNIFMINGVSAADLLIIPATPARLSTAGIRQLLDTVKRVAKHVNRSLIIGGVAITNSRLHTTSHRKAIVSMYKDYQDLNVYETYIPQREAISLACENRISVIKNDPKSDAADQYRMLTKEIIHHGE